MLDDLQGMNQILVFRAPFASRPFPLIALAIPHDLPISQSISPAIWKAMCQEWGTVQSSNLPDAERVPALYKVVHPMIQDAVRRVGLIYSYLLQERELPLILMARIEARENLPEQLEALTILFESSILRWVSDQGLETTCDFRNPMAPWVEFCQRVNRLRPSFRNYFFAFLPRSSEGQVTPGWAGRKPNWNWAKLWDRITEDIPGATLPLEWKMIRKSIAVPAPVPGPNQLVVPQVLKPRDYWREQLAKPLLQAGLFVESRRPAWVRFKASPLLLPVSSEVHGRKVRALIKRIGGLPSCDQGLGEMLHRIQEWGHDSSSISELDPIALLCASKELGFESHQVETYLGAIQQRRTQPLEANRHFQRSLREARDPADISTSLSNLAAGALMRGDLAQAVEFAEEALRYISGNEMAQWNLMAANHALQTQSEDSGTHG